MAGTCRRCILRPAQHTQLQMVHGAFQGQIQGNAYRADSGKYSVAACCTRLLAVLGCLLSGIFASQFIFDIGNGSTIELGRFLHLVTTAWAFILMSVHLGLHWAKFVGMARKISVNQNDKALICRIFRVFILVSCIYGVYLFIDRRFWEELFHLIDYQKEYDTSKIFFEYFIESSVLSTLFVAITYYAKKFALHKKQPSRKEKL